MRNKSFEGPHRTDPVRRDCARGEDSSPSPVIALLNFLLPVARDIPLVYRYILITAVYIYNTTVEIERRRSEDIAFQSTREFNIMYL